MTAKECLNLVSASTASHARMRNSALTQGPQIYPGVGPKVDPGKSSKIESKPL